MANNERKVNRVFILFGLRIKVKSILKLLFSSSFFDSTVTFQVAKKNFITTGINDVNNLFMF